MRGTLCTALVWLVAAGELQVCGAQTRIGLHEGWAIQSSEKVREKGETISSKAFIAPDWYSASMPSTVLAALVANKVYHDPYFGMNLRAIPGMGYPIGRNFANLPMPADSPFRKTWWYRKQFELSGHEGQQIWLHFDGINYRANIWLNGHLIADSTQVAGAYRIYDFDVTENVVTGTNTLAVELSAPEANDLAIEWVDWNPAPPDKDMGIWRDVYLATNGPVALRFPQVVTKLDLPSLGKAHLTVTAELRNALDKPAQVVLKGQIEKIQLSQRVDLAPGETKLVTFSPAQFEQLNIVHPRVWWPVQMGAQNLYELRLQIEVSGKVSDQDSVRFGIREVTSELTDKNYRVFLINGRRVLIRGGGWAPDMMLRSSPEREAAEIRYVKDMNLNAIRFEGKTESNRFLDMCDREGILVIAGWCCCSHWELWKNWKEEDYRVSADSLRDQVQRIRNHPSVITWWYGSDGPPPPDVEKKYIEVLKANNWPNPYQSSAAARPTELAGPTGLKMTGPYDWVPPSYWLEDTKHGGAYGFNTETSPGPAVPPLESLRQIIPQDHLWPIDDVWNFHAGGSRFMNIRIFTDALNARLGAATGVEDFAQKSQVMTYEGQRAMFEAYGRNKYTATGVIQWMMNNAWPSLIWHLYDYFLRPAGGYFGTKKACEPLHIQYSYDDRSVVVVNSFPGGFKNLKAKVGVYNLDMSEQYSRQQAVDARADSSTRVLQIPDVAGLSTTHFVSLSLEDAAGSLVSRNFYWLSTKPDTVEEEKTKDTVYTPTRSYADFTALSTLPRVDLKSTVRFEKEGSDQIARVTVENPTRNLAFFVRLRVTKGQEGDEILPVLWQDNYLSLLPGEKREVTARYSADQLQGAATVLQIDGWNIIPKSVR